MSIHHLRGLVALTALLCAPSAFACSLLGPQPHELIEGSDDATAPSTPTLGALTISRGRGPKGGMSTSCDDIGWITLPLTAEDDASDAASIGYVLALTAGSLPFDLPTEPVRPQSDEGLTLNWIDEATNEQEPLEATLEVVAVDEAGNVSAEPLVVEISDPGRSAGCAAVPAASAWALLGLLALRRRR
jgi:hypothetical protein